MKLILCLVTSQTAVKDLVVDLNQHVIEVCKLLDQTERADDRQRLSSHLLDDEERLHWDKKEGEGLTLALLNQWCSKKSPSEATVEHLINALKSSDISDAANIMQQYCKVMLLLSNCNVVLGSQYPIPDAHLALIDVPGWGRLT